MGAISGTEVVSKVVDEEESDIEVEEKGTIPARAWMVQCGGGDGGEDCCYCC